MKHTATIFLLLLILGVSQSGAQSSTFTYQGRLVENGAPPITGTRNLTFSLWNAAVDGAQIAAPIGPLPVAIANGIFTVELDFTAAPFTGGDVYLAVSVGNEPLSPRQKIGSAPYSVRASTAQTAVTAGNAAMLGGIPASQYLQTSGAPITGDVQFTGHLLLAPAGPIASKGVTPPATLYAVNSQPGIANPSETNLPPAAVRGDATSTVESNAGLLGIANGAAGIGVIGITNGIGTESSDAAGVFGLSTGTSGPTIGVFARVASPTGTAIEAQTSSTGLIFKGSSDNNTSGNPKITISASGNLITNGGVRAKNFFLNSDNMFVTENGNIATNGLISAASLDTTGNVLVGGTVEAENVDASGGLVTAGTVNSASLVVGNVSSPGGTVIFNANVQSSGEGSFQNIRTGVLGGGDVHVCLASMSTNYLRNCSSSLRYKENVRPFTGGMDIVSRLQPIAFSWKDGGAQGIGLGAEAVARIEPRLTSIGTGGQVEGVKYDQLSTVLINALKEHQAQIEKSNRLIARQEALLRKLSAEVRRLKRGRR